MDWDVKRQKYEKNNVQPYGFRRYSMLLLGFRAMMALTISGLSGAFSRQV